MNQLKLFIESRHRTSGTPEDFVYQLPRGVDLPNSIAFLDDIVVPNMFYGIRAGRNDKLYLRELILPGPVPSYVYRTLTLPPGQYNAITFAATLTSVMNASLPSPVYTAIYDTQTAKIHVATTSSEFTFFGEAALPDLWNLEAPTAQQIAGTTTQSANKAVGFYSGQLLIGVSGAPLIASDVVDLTSHRCLYIHSDIGTPEQSFGPRGDSGVVRKVLIDAPMNTLVVDRHTTTWGGIHLDEQPLRSLRFTLRDSDGLIVDLMGHEWSFSLYIVERV